MANRTYCMLIDIKRDIFEIIKLKPVDTGNKLHIKFSEDGKPVDLTGHTVKFMAIKPDGTGVYNFATIIDAKAGEIEVEITNQMTAVEGELDCELEIEGTKLITTMTFYIEVDHKLNDGSFIESTNEFTVLQKAIRDAYEAIDLMEEKTDAKLEELQEQVDTAIDNMEATTNSKLTQVQSQVDTAISNMNTTTNNKLSQLQSQVNSAIDNMDSVTDTKLADLQKQVTNAINNMNSTTTNKLNQVQSQVDDKLTDIQEQFDTLETGLTKKVNDKITEVTGTQTTLTNKVDSKITELTNAVNSKVTEVNNKLKAVDTKITEINTTITNANTTVDKLEQDVATAIASLDSKLATKADKDHNHDSSYLKLTGGTVSGTINASNLQVGGANVYTTNRKPTPADIGASASNHTHTSLQAISLSGQTVSLDTFNLASGSPQVAHYYCPTDGGGSGITGRPNDSTKNAFSLKVELIRYASATDYITKQTYIRGNEKVIYIRYCTNGTWSAWEKVYTSSNKPTPADIGASASNHNHDSVYLGKTAKATSATVADSANAVAWANVTGKPSTFAPTSHNHDTSYLKLTGGTVSGALTITDSSADKFTIERTGNDANVAMAFKSPKYTKYFGIANGVLKFGDSADLGGTGNTIYHTGNKPTPADIGASASNHNHDSVYLGKTAKATSATVADSANAVAWANVSGKPSSFTPASHDHDSSYLKLAGGTMTGKITTSVNTSTYLAGNQGNAIINSNTSAGAYVMLYRYPSTSGYFTMGGYQGNYLLQYTAKSTVDAGTNSVTKSATLLNESGNTSFPGTVSAPTFSGTLSGNATTATTLQTARTINGTSFNGSGNITTANWGTARTITIGNTGKSVNGAGNVSWSLAEIGAVAYDYSGDSTSTYPRIYAPGKEWIRTPSGGIVPYAHQSGYLGLSTRAWYDFHTVHINSKPCRGQGGRWWNAMVDVGNDGVTEIGRYLDFHDTSATTADYTVRLTSTGSTLNCSGTFTQGSDFKLKEDIEYLDSYSISTLELSSTSEEKTITPFRDFIRDDFRPCTYRYKGTAETVVGFIAQDISDTKVGKLFTRELTTHVIDKTGENGGEIVGEETNLAFDLSGYTTIIAKALQEEILKRDSEILNLTEENERLKERLAIIEEKLGIA